MHCRFNLVGVFALGCIMIVTSLLLAVLCFCPVDSTCAAATHVGHKCMHAYVQTCTGITSATVAVCLDFLRI